MESKMSILSSPICLAPSVTHSMKCIIQMKQVTKIINARYWLVIAAILTGGMIYLGNSNHRVADTNDALSTDLQLLIEFMEYGQRGTGRYEPLVPPSPRETDSWKSMPIIQ